MGNNTYILNAFVFIDHVFFLVPIRNDSPMEYANACENAIARKNPAMILCVLARNFGDR